MSESRGWVHWHPDGYALDSNDFKVRSMDKAYVWSCQDEATEWNTEVSDECEVITYEEAAKRLAQAFMKATAEELRSGREAPKPIVNPNMAPKDARIERNTLTPEGKSYWDLVRKSAEGVNDWPAPKKAGITVEQPGIARPTEDRMMVHFWVDPSKYRVGVRKTGDDYEVTVSDRSNGLTLHRKTRSNPVDALHDAVLYSGIAESWVKYLHPWKRADGSRIKASWEE